MAEACTLLHGWIMTDYFRPGTRKQNNTKMHDDFLKYTLAISEDSFDSSDSLSKSRTRGETAAHCLEPNGASEGAQFLSSILPSLTPSVGVTAIQMGIMNRLTSIDTEQTTRLDEQFGNLISSNSICEKLLRTPIPIGYTQYS